MIERTRSWHRIVAWPGGPLTFGALALAAATTRRG